MKRKKKREARVRIVGATTTSPDSVLLQTFLRRIPLVISIPSLDERPLAERMIFIANFFSQESKKIGVPINVERDIVRALLLYDCPGNIGQLKSDIQLMCALAFVEFTKSRSEIIINKNHIKDQLRRNMKEAFEHGDLLEQFIGKEEKWCKFSHSSDSRDICLDIRNQVSEITSPYVSREKVINTTKDEAKSYYDFIQSISDHEEMIEKVFGEVVSTYIMRITEQTLSSVDFPKGIRINKSLLFSLLSIHLSFALRRIESGISLNTYDLEDVDRESQYYKIVQQMGKVLSGLINKDIPESEIDYMAFIVNKVQVWKKEELPRVAVVVSSKDEKAKQMVKMAQSLLGTDHGTALKLNSNLGSDQCKASIIQTIEEVDEGKGVVYLCDQSSIKDYIKDIRIKTGIKVEIINRVSTPIVVESIRLALEPDFDLNDVVNNLMKMTPEGSRLDLKTLRSTT